MDSAQPISGIRDNVLSANVYLGAFPLAEAIATGAHVIIAGRSTDTALTLAPMVYEFGWGADDWDKLAAGTIAGHIIECGAQTTGGNCQVDWQSIPDFANIGFPIVEAYPDGSFHVTKHEGTGGRVNKAVVSEQLLYELGDPTSYITPDCIADFTSIRLDADGPDRVLVSGADFDLLRNLARETGGTFYRLKDFDRLQQQLTNSEARLIIRSEERYDSLINLKWIFFLILVLVSGEWFLRKFYGSY
jgi:hypothetical protein